MLSPLLVVDTSICSGFECPLTVGLCLYFFVAMLGCCCCYPGACLCPQRFKDPKKTDEKASALAQINFLGSIAEILDGEEKQIQESEATAAGSENGLFRRRTRSKKPSYY